MTPRRGALARLLAAATALALGGCSLDAFLFNDRRLDRYALSSAIIPDSLRTEGDWTVGADRVAWVLARRPGAAARPTLLFCHGNKESLEPYWGRVEALWQAGFDVLVFDYRGFGRSTGRSTEATMRADADAALAFLRGRGVPDGALTVYGYSLGGVCALHLASGRVTPRALVLESAFTNAQGLVRTGAVLDIPGRFLLRDGFDNLAMIGRVSAPVLHLHGDGDTFVPFAMGEELARATRAATRRFVPVVGAGHTDIPDVLGAARFGQLLRQFHDDPAQAAATIPARLP